MVSFLIKFVKFRLCLSKKLSGVGFEPTPPLGDQKSRILGRYLTLSLAP